MLPAVIVLTFDSYAQMAGLTVPLRAIALAAAIAVALVVAAAFASGVPELRRDDLLYLAVGAVPGAVAGGRLVHVLAYLDYYARDPGAIVDPAQGSLSLLGALLGGTASAAAVAALVGAPPRLWLGAVAVPVLLLIGLGKIAQLLGGGGQGLPWDGSWAVAFTGRGPWLTASPSLPSHPSQLYESAWVLIALPAVTVVAVARGWRWRRPAGLYALVLGWWVIGRAVVGFTWRDVRNIGPFNVEQALALLTLALLLVAVAVAVWRSPRRESTEPVAAGALPVDRIDLRPERRRRGRGKRRRSRDRRLAAEKADWLG